MCLVTPDSLVMISCTVQFALHTLDGKHIFHAHVVSDEYQGSSRLPVADNTVL